MDLMETDKKFIQQIPTAFHFQSSNLLLGTKVLLHQYWSELRIL
jgi:hypothetical protein